MIGNLSSSLENHLAESAEQKKDYQLQSKMIKLEDMTLDESISKGAAEYNVQGGMLYTQL